MRLRVLLLLILFGGCASEPINTESEGTESLVFPGFDGSRGYARYECYTYDYPAQRVLTLPVPVSDEDIPIVQITFHGDGIAAIYERDGLKQIWIIEPDLYMQIDPDLNGFYMDFRGAEEGEKRQPEAVFECKKRR